MNAGFGKQFWSLADDRWELSECLYASVITLTTVGYADVLGTGLCRVERDGAGQFRWTSQTDGHQDPGFDPGSAELYFDFSSYLRLLTTVHDDSGTSDHHPVVAKLALREAAPE